MLVTTKVIETFPSVRIASRAGGPPVEVALILQLGHGSGDPLIETAAARQRGHAGFIDALDEPSAKLGATDLANGDATSLYSFIVGAHGHPFHRHAGHRVFTAVSGSGGTQLRFSTAAPDAIARDPDAFVAALQHVNIPPDCLFTVRFGGGVWHQFVPLDPAHPAMFALSCHTNELGGDLSDELRRRVLDDGGDIPSLTEVIPSSLGPLLDRVAGDASRVPTFALSLDAAPESLLAAFCRVTRGTLGRIRGAWGRWRRPRGYFAENGGGREVRLLPEVPTNSLLRTQLDGAHTHEDTFELTLAADDVRNRTASALLAGVLDGFLENRPLGVTRLMALRNALVRPLGLRTSPLGCPVSSLLSPRSEALFADRFPVHGQRIDALDRHAQVILGADDRHLVFRSCVGVELLRDGGAKVTLGTRVRTHNLFGTAYMAVVDRVHRDYIAPALLRLAVDRAVRR
jgi:hypothetical protein